RHISQHSGGMIVSSGPMTDLVPVQPAAMEGRFLCQWDKDSCDFAGFVKIDFLALGMLSLVEDLMSLIAESGAHPPDLSRIDFEDPAVYDMIQKGDTIGVFQVESRAQIQTVLKTRPRNLNDLTVQVAIVRPGPIVGGATAPYIQSRQQGWVEPVYDHPCLEPVLKETHGIILYQEQVVDVAIALADFTPGQADSLRRAMTRKRSHDAMTSHWEAFRDGAWRARGASEEVARSVFARLLGFSSYGFPKGHAASFAVLAYQSCWLKKYYPAEFLCGLLNNQPMGFYAPHVLVNDGKRHGIRVERPSINTSRTKCHVEYANNKTVRIGFAFVKGMGEEEANRIVAERTAGGPFRSLPDFIRRVSLRTEAIENLISVGAFDEFGLNRREALWQVGLFIPNQRFGHGPEKLRKVNRHRGMQLSLPLPVEQDQVNLPTTTAWERMAADYQIIGMSPSYHPLGLLRSRLPAGIVSTRDLIALPHGADIRIGGLVVCRQRPGTAKGVTFLLLEDEYDLINVVVYASLYEAQRTLVRAEPFVLVEGTVQREDRNLNLIAHRFTRLDDVVRPAPGRHVTIREIIEEEREGAIDRDLSPSSHNYR
ncbi:MAG: error-prone DNA polymerase, partial [Thermomicrobiales bacterium]|nr:error-prone DNA polymerase [Thermomicrobiales bacterium]